MRELEARLTPVHYIVGGLVSQRQQVLSVSTEACVRRNDAFNMYHTCKHAMTTVRALACSPPRHR